MNLPETIPPGEVRWLTEKLGDDIGRVFAHGGRIYRAIYPGGEDRVRAMLDRRIVAELVERGWLVPTTVSTQALAGFPLLLEHRRVPFYTAGFEWPGPLLRDAARVWLGINKALLPHGLALSDAHPYNFGQIDACRPVWLDLGSLRPPASANSGLEQFRQYFLHPLQLATRTRRLARLSHALLRTGGVTDREMESLAGALLPARHKPLEHVWRRARSLLGTRGKPAPRPDLEERRGLLEALEAELDAMRFPGLDSYWGTYHERHKLPITDLDAAPPNERSAAILRAIESLRPRRMIDLASNAGYFSLHAARSGAEVLAVDYDEASIEQLYSHLRRESPPWSVTCAVRDITEPITGERAIRVERTGDLVLALAITHHLAMTEGYTFAFLADMLSRYTSDAALVEFMPYGSGVTGPKPDPLPAWYTVEGFLEALRTQFATAEVIADNHEQAWRILVLCRGSRAHG